MKRLFAVGCGLALVLSSSPARADHYHRYYHHDDDDEVAAAVVGGVVGLIAGYAIGSNGYYGYRNYGYRNYGYYGYPAYPRYGYGYGYAVPAYPYPPPPPVYGYYSGQPYGYYGGYGAYRGRYVAPYHRRYTYRRPYYRYP